MRRSTAASELRNLPSVDALLRHHAVSSLLDEFPREELVQCVRSVLEHRRAALRDGDDVPLDMPSLALEIHEAMYRRRRPSLRRVINATGVVLHTGLGRAPLAEAAMEAVAEVAGGYSNLEYDLAAGQRGDRHTHVRELLRELTGAEDALVVNNNAAGTYLTLRGLACGRGVVVSRGQLVEIGGSYRMPDIMAAAGCRMIEVGTTNRTHLRDYERAIDGETSVLLRVHTSNYRVEGFTAAPSLRELATLARRFDSHELHVVDDLGSGLLVTPNVQAEAGTLARLTAEWDEPSVRESVAAGADVTLFSGDKLLGGPQAGIIVGRAALLARLRSDPLARTFRPDKMTLAALEATLRLYRDPESLLDRLPVYRMLIRDIGALREAAEQLAKAIQVRNSDAEAHCVKDESFAGGGSLPTIPFATWVVRVRIADAPAATLAARLRDRDVPVICRVHHDELVFDCRTIREGDAAEIAVAVNEAASTAANE